MGIVRILLIAIGIIIVVIAGVLPSSSKTRQPAINSLVTLVATFAGVFLAFYLNSYLRQRQEKDYLAGAFAGCWYEMRSNIDIVLANENLPSEELL